MQNLKQYLPEVQQNLEQAEQAKNALHVAKNSLQQKIDKQAAAESQATREENSLKASSDLERALQNFEKATVDKDKFRSKVRELEAKLQTIIKFL